jgi:hypothetical protein
VEKLEYYGAKGMPKAQSAQPFNTNPMPKFWFIKIWYKINELFDYRIGRILKLCLLGGHSV